MARMRLVTPSLRCLMAHSLRDLLYRFCSTYQLAFAPLSAQSTPRTSVFYPVPGLGSFRGRDFRLLWFRRCLASQAPACVLGQCGQAKRTVGTWPALGGVDWPDDWAVTCTRGSAITSSRRRKSHIEMGVLAESEVRPLKLVRVSKCPSACAALEHPRIDKLGMGAFWLAGDRLPARSLFRITPNS